MRRRGRDARACSAAATVCTFGGTFGRASARPLPRAGVPPDRQKLMCKAWKGVLKDDATLAGLALDGAAVTLMGSADAPAAKPVERTVRHGGGG